MDERDNAKLVEKTDDGTEPATHDIPDETDDTVELGDEGREGRFVTSVTLVVSPTQKDKPFLFDSDGSAVPEKDNRRELPAGDSLEEKSAVQYETSAPSSPANGITAASFELDIQDKRPSVGEVEVDTSHEQQSSTALNQLAADTLRQTSTDSSEKRHEIVVELDTFQRSSTRRSSFVLAIEGGEGGVVTDTKTEDNAYPHLHTAETASPLQGQSQHRTDGDGASLDVHEMEIFVDDENDSRQRIWRHCQGTRKWVCCVIVLVLLAVVMTIILIPQSLVYVEYHQMALARSRVTGRVDRERTLYSGCYLLFPDTELITFQATAHNLHTKLEVTSADGLALDLQLSLQYFINGEELGELHKTYGEKYTEVVQRVIESEVKNNVVHFTLDQYRLNRTTVEQSVYRHLATALQGDCCPSCCPRRCAASSQWSGNNCNTCSTSPNCARGLHLTLQPQHLQLGAIHIPREVNERYLRFTLLQVEAEKEALVQESKVEMKRTELLTQDIRNQAQELREAARSSARRLSLEAEASAEVTRQTAYTQAMKSLLGDLNFTTTQHRLSVLLMLTYRDISDRLYFEQLDKLSLYGGLT